MYYTHTLIAAAVWCGVVSMKAGPILTSNRTHNWDIARNMWGGGVFLVNYQT